MTDYPEILKKTPLTKEERKCIGNQIQMGIRDRARAMAITTRCFMPPEN